MLTPATSATAFVVNPTQPVFAKTRAAAVTIAFTVSRERACCGAFRIVFFTGRMRVAKLPPLLEYEYKLTLGERQLKAAVVAEFGMPYYGDFEEPVPRDGEVLVHVTASALSNFSKVRAAGNHPSYTVQPPFVPGFDGAGVLEDGQRVYFSFPRDPFGGMAQRTVIRRERCIAAPAGVSDADLAALPDPGFSAWAALTSRAQFVAGETVLVNGATGTAGSMAVQIAKHLGAAKVIVTGRNAAALDRLRTQGADVTLLLQGSSTLAEQAMLEQFSSGVDVVLDYLWGASAEQLLHAAARVQRGRLRFVQIGAASGERLTLEAPALRHSAIELLGCSISNVSPREIARCVAELIDASATANFSIATRSLPLEHVADAWTEPRATPRLVFAP